MPSKDNAVGLFPEIEERWEAASQGMMHLMDFGIEALILAQGHIASNNLKKAGEYLNTAAIYTKAGASLMRQLGEFVSASEYSSFRKTRDIKGSLTDEHIVASHKKQKELIFAISYEIKRLSDGDINNAIVKNPGFCKLAHGVLILNDAHRVVFGSHKFVCTKMVPKEEKSLRGGDITTLVNNDLSDMISELRAIFKQRPQDTEN